MAPAHTSDRTLFVGTPPTIEQVSRNRKGFWASTILTLLGLMLSVVLLNFVLPLYEKQLDGLSLIVAGLAVSLAPSLLWLLFFYQFERFEQEPKRNIVRVFVFALLLAVAMALPLLNGIFQIDTWLNTTWWSQLVGSILMLGFAQTAVIYVALRYGIYFYPEFNERVDGVIYGTVAGLGLATALNLVSILEQGSLYSAIDSMHVVTRAVAYAGLGGLVGYYLGRSRFEITPFYYLPGGITISAIIAGLFHFLQVQITAAGEWQDITLGLLMAILFATVNLGIVYLLVRRANAESLRLAGDSLINSKSERPIAEANYDFQPHPKQQPEPAMASAPTQSHTEMSHVSAKKMLDPAPVPSLQKPDEAKSDGKHQETEQGSGSLNKDTIVRELEESWQALMGDRAAAEKRDASQIHEELLI